MNTFLACSGMNGDETKLKKLVEIANARQPDAILFSGGITKMGANSAAKRESLKKCFEILGKGNCLSLIIPGAQDAPLTDYMRVAINAEVTYSNVISVHASLYPKSGVAVSGIGGDINEFEDSLDPIVKYSHTSAEYYLRSLWHSTMETRITIFSEPPTGKLSGDRGSALVDEFIKTYHPSICVAGGKRENRGFQKEKHGLVVNPGMLTEDSAAWINWADKSVQLIDLEVAAGIT